MTDRPHSEREPQDQDNPEGEEGQEPPKLSQRTWVWFILVLILAVTGYHWLDMQMALFEAGDRGGEWAVLPDEDGNLTEATGANIWVVRDGVALTPDSGCLEGITRQSVFDLCAELGVGAKATRIPAAELFEAEEVFLTTTAGSIMPVRSVDGRPVGGREGAGEISVALHNRYWERRWDGWDATPVRYA